MRISYLIYRRNRRCKGSKIHSVVHQVDRNVWNEHIYQAVHQVAIRDTVWRCENPSCRQTWDSDDANKQVLN